MDRVQSIASACFFAGEKKSDKFFFDLLSFFFGVSVSATYLQKHKKKRTKRKTPLLCLENVEKAACIFLYDPPPPSLFYW